MQWNCHVIKKGGRGAKWPSIAVLMENVFRKTFSARGVLYDGIHNTSTRKT
jgi:hypothetical protein